MSHTYKVKSPEEIRYDENVKKFLSQKIILAHILAYAVTEFQGMKPTDILPYITGTPSISDVEIDRSGSNSTDFIVGKNTEDSDVKEGKITYDILFDVRLPNSDSKHKVKLIIDIEAQNEFYPGYVLVSRGIYYCARLLSSQKGIEFSKDNYDSIQKVYSIFICMKCPKDAQNTITAFSVNRHNLIGNYQKQDAAANLLSVVLIGLSEDIADNEDSLRLHRLLEIFFSPELTTDEKCEILKEEYDIIYENEPERRLLEMCNVSQYFIERGIAQGMERGIAQGMERGIAQGKVLALYQFLNMDAAAISQKLDIPLEEVEEILSVQT